ncbi:MAG TPA: hypothetical protein VIX89_19070 [Bryobacteraceae bacterium]
MKRSRFWLTMISAFALPVLMFAQATGGSTCSKVKEGGTGKTTGGKKKTRESKVVGKKGAKTKTTGAACTGKKKVDEPDTGKKKN